MRIRRSCSDRVYLLLLAALTAYIIWYTYEHIHRAQRDPVEEQAYLNAISGSVPIIHNSQLCTSNNIDLIIVIISSGTHFLERQSIRETWRSFSKAFDIQSRHIFVLGYQYGLNLYKSLSKESQNEQDLLYLTIDDSLMTVKELHAYRWIEKHCPYANFTFKTEDDLFVNSFLLHELVRELKTKPDQYRNRYLYNSSIDSLFLAHLNPDAHTFLFGWAFQAGTPERNSSVVPYYVSYNEYPNEMYPRYCSGFGYLMDSETRNALTEEGFKDKTPFRFSDIFVTGILPERLNFICDVLPFTYNQGSSEECIRIIKQNNMKGVDAEAPPLIVCSTGLHVAQNTFSDYYRIWSVMKYVYSDRVHISKTTNRKNI